MDGQDARPSPHRFVAKSKTDIRPSTKAPKRFSHGSIPHGASDQTPSSAVPQFSKALRFSTARPQQSQQLQEQSSSTPKPRFSLTHTTQREDVEDSQSQEEENTPHAQPDVHPVLPSIESRLDNYAQPDQYPAKRPRYENPNEASQAQQPAPLRFMLSQANLQSEDATPMVTKPGFLRSLTSSREPTVPLPEVFSPHKRGHRFIAGGMASELQSWILEAGSTASQGRRIDEPAKSEIFAHTIRVAEVSGDGPFFIQGEDSEGERGLILLIPDKERFAGSRIGQINAGDLVGIRRPTWQLEMLNESCTVSVDYKVI